MNSMARFLRKAGLALALLCVAGSAPAAIRINEIRTDTPGTDTDEYFELIGPPGTSLAGLTYIVLGDSGTVHTCGVIESITDLSGFSIQPDGLLCLRNSAATPVLSGYDGSVPLTFENTDNVTHMLVSGFTGTLLQKLDTNDDGVLDITPWTSIVDCIGLDKGTVPNCAGEEYLYCSTKIGPDGGFVPSHVYRYSDTGTWALGLFSPLGTTDTPGSPNPSLNQPIPLYADMTRDPCVPLASQPATVVAGIKNNPTRAELRYTVNGGAENALNMDVYGTAHDTVYFYAQIPGQANGARVEYYCNAWNANPAATRSYDQGYFAGTMTVAALRVNDANGSNLYRYYGARVRGRVTAAYGVFGTTNTDYYMQDATGGINVFKFGPHTVHPALGDSITVAGALDQYNGKLELTAASSCDTVLVTIQGSGSPPAPLVVNACALSESHEGRLVKVQNLLIGTRGDLSFVGNTSYKANNCYTDSIEMFVDIDTNIPGTPITSSHVNVIGIAGQFDSSTPYDYWYQVQPRSLSDITFLSMTSAPAPPAESDAALWAPNPLGRVAEIRYRVPGTAGEAARPVRLAFYDLRGRAIATLVNGPATPGVHTVTVDRDALGAAGSGVIFCRYEVSGQVIARKLVMMR